jgi:hypothetical protein
MKAVAQQNEITSKILQHLQYLSAGCVWGVDGMRFVYGCVCVCVCCVCVWVVYGL